MEGVADSPAATRLAALASIRERVQGIKFTILAGKYPAYSLTPSDRTLDTRGTRLVETVKLPSGMYKSRLEVEVSPLELAPQEGLREFAGSGEADLSEAGGRARARMVALETAVGQAIINAVAQRYPPSSVPFQLTGTVYILGTRREEIRRGSYLVEVRARVALTAE